MARSYGNMWPSKQSEISFCRHCFVVTSQPLLHHSVHLRKGKVDTFCGIELKLTVQTTVVEGTQTPQPNAELDINSVYDYPANKFIYCQEREF